MTVNREGIDSQILQELMLFSAVMERGGRESVDGLYRLKEIYECDMVDVSRQMEKDPERLTAIWIVQGFIEKLWDNLGGDSSGFPKEKGTPYIIEISERLGQFIQESLSGKGKPMEAFTKVIEAYFGLLRLVEEDLQKGRSLEEEWCFL